ncbi:Las17-binding protein actin regulator [Ruegeria halocynthiae]|uniref:Las17-binding protein actin regulator n=1 Tax=Ruegeria halocynthiae TaxID=985054 RepID=A0A1H2SVP4_9RHOB|nr:YSC84-related protein [Ruegeria halocynthiae]SDW35597.1 Las17-binding protein actin regulator [Ruegeria halocynthiae]
MSSSISPRLSRRGFTFGMAGLTLTAACSNGVGNSNAVALDARVDATLNEMYSKYPNTVDIANKANGMLVMPLITDAGLIFFGGAYGQGALRIQGATVDYYSAISGTAGLQIGAQQYAHVLFFMTEDALNDFRRSSGWTAGADIGYVVDATGESLSTDTNQLGKPVLAAVFGQAGLKFGATIEGTKYTRIIP